MGKSTTAKRLYRKQGTAKTYDKTDLSLVRYRDIETGKQTFVLTSLEQSRVPLFLLRWSNNLKVPPFWILYRHTSLWRMANDGFMIYLQYQLRIAIQHQTLTGFAIRDYHELSRLFYPVSTIRFLQNSILCNPNLNLSTLARIHHLHPHLHRLTNPTPTTARQAHLTR